MDTVVHLEPGVLLQNLTKANAAKVKRLRWSVQEEDWFPVTRDSRVDRRFWTLLQASFYETYQRRGHRIFPHRVLDWVSLRIAVGGADVREHFAHFRGLPRLLQMEQNRYIEDWVRVFYAIAWIAPEHRAVHFVFGGQVFGLSRATIAGILGVDLVDVSLHEMVYGDADPPRRWYNWRDCTFSRGDLSVLPPAVSSLICQSSQPADPRGIHSSHGPPEDSITEELLPVTPGL